MNDIQLALTTAQTALPGVAGARAELRLAEHAALRRDEAGVVAWGRRALLRGVLAGAELHDARLFIGSHADTSYGRAVLAANIGDWPQRAESAVVLARHHRLRAEWPEAYVHASIACGGPVFDGEGADPEVYRYRRWWELAVAAWWFYRGPVPIGRYALAMLGDTDRPDVALLRRQYDGAVL